MLGVEDWAEIRRLRQAGQLSISEIARVLGISRNTVRSALARDGAPRYVRAPAGSVVDAVEPRIRELLRAYPRMPATVIAERIGWTRSIRTLSGRVAELRPAYLPPDRSLGCIWSRTLMAAWSLCRSPTLSPPGGLRGQHRGELNPDAAFWSVQLARTAPSGVGGLLAADRANPARWLREAGITPGRAAALAPGAATGLCYYGT